MCSGVQRVGWGLRGWLGGRQVLRVGGGARCMSVVVQLYCESRSRGEGVGGVGLQDRGWGVWVYDTA